MTVFSMHCSTGICYLCRLVLFCGHACCSMHVCLRARLQVQVGHHAVYFSARGWDHTLYVSAGALPFSPTRVPLGSWAVVHLAIPVTHFVGE